MTRRSRAKALRLPPAVLHPVQARGSSGGPPSSHTAPTPSPGQLPHHSRAGASRLAPGSWSEGRVSALPPLLCSASEKEPEGPVAPADCIPAALTSVPPAGACSHLERPPPAFCLARPTLGQLLKDLPSVSCSWDLLYTHLDFLLSIAHHLS